MLASMAEREHFRHLFQNVLFIVKQNVSLRPKGNDMKVDFLYSTEMLIPCVAFLGMFGVIVIVLG